MTTILGAAAKSLQSCPILCDPIDGSPPGSPVPGILQARTLEWVAISFSNAWKWKVKGKSLSCVRLFTTPWTAAYQAPPSMGFSRQEYWSGVPSPSPNILGSAALYPVSGASQMVPVVKNSPASAGDIRDMGFFPGLGRSPGGGHGTQYSCLDNPMDRGAWWATIHRVKKSQTRLKQLSTHTLFQGYDLGQVIKLPWIFSPFWRNWE